MAVLVNIDLSGMLKGLGNAESRALEAVFSGVKDVSEELGRLSLAQVPHDIGTLSQSLEIVYDRAKLESTVSYNTPYAARLHEHPEYRFQKGRKGKFLEDPANENASVFKDHIIQKVKRAL